MSHPCPYCQNLSTRRADYWSTCHSHSIPVNIVWNTAYDVQEIFFDWEWHDFIYTLSLYLISKETTIWKAAKGPAKDRVGYPILQFNEVLPITPDNVIEKIKTYLTFS